MKLNQRSLAAACAALMTLTLVPVAGVSAQVTAHRRRMNVVQRHPTATGVAAGVGTHAALKASARRKKARHQKLSFAERHPTLIGDCRRCRHPQRHQAHHPALTKAKRNTALIGKRSSALMRASIKPSRRPAPVHRRGRAVCCYRLVASIAWAS